jgi:hypothetical protein
MFYAGLDIHTKHNAICALSETGQVVHRSPVRSIEEMVQTLSPGAPQLRMMPNGWLGSPVLVLLRS